MYNPGITVPAPGTAFAANSRIDIIDISLGGAKQVIFNITTPWNTIAPDGFGTEGNIFRWTDPSGNYILMMKILTVNESARTATFSLLSFAKVSADYFTTTHNIPSSTTPNNTIGYTFEITNKTSNQMQLRWILGSQESTGTGTFADWIEPDQLESFPPTTIVRNKNCWYEDWATGGTCSTGQTIMPGPGGFIRISGNLTVFAPAGKRENITLAIFTLISNFWKTINPNSPGGDEYVLSYIGDSIKDVSILSDPCIGKICDPNYICIGCLAYDTVCNPSDPTGPCIQGSRNTTKDPNCAFGYFSITSTPTGANIYVDNTLDGTTGPSPVIIQLPSGISHNVRLTKSGYEDWNSGNIIVTCGETVVINPTLTISLPDIYELRLKLDSITTASYVTQTINSFANLFNGSLLSVISGIQVNNVTYVQTNHEIVIELQQIQSLSSSPLSLSLSSLSSSPLSLSLSSLSSSPLSLSLSSLSSSPLSSATLPPLWVTLLIPLIPVVLSIPLLIIGYILKTWTFAKKVLVPSRSNVILKMCVSVSPTNCANPIEDVIVEYADQTQTANAANNFQVTFADIPVTGVDQYPIKAYIPLSAGSKVYKASHEGFVVPIIPETRETISLQINHTSERDFTLCRKYTDGTNLDTGTIIVVYYESTDQYGAPKREEFGKVAVQADGCIPPVKVPSYYTNDMISTITVANNISPNAPSPLPQKGSDTITKRINEIKNAINVYTFSTNNNPIIVDNIAIIDTGTNTAIKNVKPTDSYTMIEEIPIGTYRVEVTMSGYKFSSCTNNCTVTFTADYLQATSFTIVLESIVKTCDLTIYVLDKYGKPLKTVPSMSIDNSTPRIIDVNKLEIKDMITKSHHFKVTADSYKTLEVDRTISCTDTTAMEIFKMDPEKEIEVPAAMDMTINNLKGSVSIDKNVDIPVKITGANPGELVEIKNISSTPDTLLTSGIAGGDGILETTLTFATDITLEVQAFQGCICALNVCTCSKNSNIAELKVGAGSPECSIPNPLGGCILEKSTGIGLMALAGLGLILGIMLIRPGGVAERVVERYPVPTRTPSATSSLTSHRPIPS